ncbi:MAG: FAD-dependent oxidoreductase [Gammaproteobacteria bacterium]|nr:FAD-dependent oxidoreductase [Gammaproteobacteria bacterium]
MAATGESVLIVGGGQAAAQLVVSLRLGGHEGRITLVSDENAPPYQRPPLSKQYLAGELKRERLLLRRTEYYESRDVELRLGRRVLAVDRSHRLAVLDNGEELGYDRLVLATGSILRKLDVPGSDLPGIHYLRSLDDADALHGQLAPGRRIVIVGGGYIGLEVAATAAKAGAEVSVLEAEERVMSRVASASVADWLTGLHRQTGVSIRVGEQVRSFAGRNRVEAVETGNGALAADAVVVGIGVLPSADLARGCGLGEDDGILTDEHCRTEDESVLATGDCARAVNTAIGTAVRLESVQNAVDHGQVAASVILGDPKPYSSVPWFWSDQFHVKLQIAGLARPGDDTVLRGDPTSGSFAAFRLRDGRLTAVEAVSSPRDFMAGKKLIASGAAPDPGLLIDESVPLKDLAQS